MTNENLTLPLLPLQSGVVLPGMVFTMALETDEARAAAEAARSAGGRLLLVPHIEGRYATVGVVAEVIEEGDLPGGLPAVAIRRRPAAPSSARACPAPATPCGWRRSRSPRSEPTRPPPSSPASTGRCSRTSCSAAARAGSRRSCARSPTRAAWPTCRATRPTSRSRRRSRCSRRSTSSERLRLVLGWARDTLADLTLRERIKTDVEEGMEKTQREFLLRRQLEAIRKELGQLGGGRRRRGRPRRLPSQGRRSATCPRTVRKAVEREVDKLERTSEQNPEHGWIRTWLDTVLELPVGRRVRGPARHRRGRPHPRRRPRRAGGREGAHPRAPGRAQAAGRAGLAPVDGRGSGRDPRPGRASGVGQDLARRVRGPRARTAVRPGRRSAACATRPRSVATAAPTSAPSRVGWCGPCARPGR